MKPPSLTVQTLADALSETLQLAWIAGQRGATHDLSCADSPTGGASLVNHLNLINPCAIQIIGPLELSHLTALAQTDRAESIQRLFTHALTVILSDGVVAPPALRDAADRHAVALFGTPLDGEKILVHLRRFLSEALAERATVHGVCLEVLGIGVLLTGASNVGKSELALELVTRGHRLIADDAPEFARITPDTLQARCPAVLQDLLEVRGLGLLNVRAMYGDNAVKQTKNLRLVIELRHTAPTPTDLVRLHGTYDECTILGITVPVIVIHVAPSRNVAVLVEAAVRKHLLHETGYDAADDLARRQLKLIEAQHP
ncbi:HPr(Ser) kinase/phosphatase [Acidihalobacter ferrooxydans]|uniref:HPr(Ser) kinase/phosphatase n=1 Tax=Acidihalobacter ferrooxydans TaxID=1765967 RepID=A0A1P8UJB5_9GAMM|nr:HPr(Ser) kinase/phosphatase [Acidihalobacter ferrooxydans]APZ43938.1 HPr(Ser) kinase/phosphatase [Acidihalobacter ferrooxydans]